MEAVCAPFSFEAAHVLLVQCTCLCSFRERFGVKQVLGTTPFVVNRIVLRPSQTCVHSVFMLLQRRCVVCSALGRFVIPSWSGRARQ